jgi:NADPH:quinone reductase-like Zn-dependent oxidoreductase
LDAALVTAGGESTDLALRAMKKDGRVAYPNGVMPVPKAPSGVRVQNYDIEPTPQQIERLNLLIESGPFEVHVARTFPLDKAADAHRELDKHYLGKLALRPQ